MNGTGAYALLALPFFGVTAVVGIIAGVVAARRARAAGRLPGIDALRVAASQLRCLPERWMQGLRIEGGGWTRHVILHRNTVRLYSIAKSYAFLP